MTKILIYGYCVGVFSSRRMQKKLSEDVGFRVLAAGNEPDFRTISGFRKLHLGARTLTGCFHNSVPGRCSAFQKAILGRAPSRVIADRLRVSSHARFGVRTKNISKES